MKGFSLTEADEEEIRAAVAAAEQRTSGEIVPYVVTQSGRYDLAVWRGASLLAVLALTVAALIFQFYAGWGLAWLHTGWGVALVTLLAATGGALAAAYIPTITRWLAGENYMAEMVHLRAMQAFVEEEVFATRDRTGILLFISLLEHRIEVLGDEGINQQVTEDDWVGVIERVRTGIKNGRVTQGIVDALGLCGGLLERCGVEIQPDDEDELSNEIRFRKGK